MTGPTMTTRSLSPSISPGDSHTLRPRNQDSYAVVQAQREQRRVSEYKRKKAAYDEAVARTNAAAEERRQRALDKKLHGISVAGAATPPAIKEPRPKMTRRVGKGQPKQVLDIDSFREYEDFFAKEAIRAADEEHAMDVAESKRGYDIQLQNMEDAAARFRAESAAQAAAKAEQESTAKRYGYDSFRDLEIATKDFKFQSFLKDIAGTKGGAKALESWKPYLSDEGYKATKEYVGKKRAETVIAGIVPAPMKAQTKAAMQKPTPYQGETYNAPKAYPLTIAKPSKAHDVVDFLSAIGSAKQLGTVTAPAFITGFFRKALLNDQMMKDYAQIKAAEHRQEKAFDIYSKLNESYTKNPTVLTLNAINLNIQKMDAETERINRISGPYAEQSSKFEKDYFTSGISTTMSDWGKVWNKGVEKIIPPGLAGPVGTFTREVAKFPGHYAAFGGMAVTGVEFFARDPIRAAMAVPFGLTITAAMMAEEAQRDPVGFAGSLTGMYLGPKLIPVKYAKTKFATGKDTMSLPKYGIFGTRTKVPEFLTYRGFSFESPVLSLSKGVGKTPEWARFETGIGARHLGGVSNIGFSDITVSLGNPKQIIPFITRQADGGGMFVPMAGDSRITVPLMRDILRTEGKTCR